MSHIVFSEKESALFNLRFGRYEGSKFNTQELVAEIKAKQLDFVRLKIIGADESLFSWLNETQEPWHLLDIHRYYWLDTLETPVVLKNDLQLTLTLNTIDTVSTMHQLVCNTFSEMPMGFFKHHLIQKYFPIELQRQNVAQYISTQYTDSSNPGKQSWLIKQNGKLVGCGATNFLPDEAYTVYIGLLPEHRKKSLYDNVINLMQYTIQQNGARYITGSARLHNLSSQAVFERQNERYTRHDYVIMLMPMLSIAR